MKGTAHIIHHDGGLVLPANTPYDRQNLFENVALYAKRYGSVRVSLYRNEWAVASTAAASHVCTACKECTGQITYTNGARILCHRCARRDLR